MTSGPAALLLPRGSDNCSVPRNCQMSRGGGRKSHPIENHGPEFIPGCVWRRGVEELFESDFEHRWILGK